MQTDVSHRSIFGSEPRATSATERACISRAGGPAGCVRSGLLTLLCACLGSGCAGAKAEPAVASPAKLTSKQAKKSDFSRCESEGRVDREAVDSVATGSLQPSIRRVYRLLGEGVERRRILVCREVDTNLDGVKDVVRRYSEFGEAMEEQADANYDGVIDTWIRFDKGRVVQVELDDGFDGQPDESRYYAKGKLTRIERDTNQDGEIDVWEIYLKGRLDRMGIDLNHDGRVDRWNRDSLVSAEVERTALDSAATAEDDAAD